MDPLSFEVDKSKYALYLFGCLAFVAVGVWMVDDGGGWTGWLVIVVFGAGAADFIWLIARPKSGPRLTINDEGLHDRMLKVGVIKWEDVLDAQAMKVGGHPYVGLALRDPEVYLSRLTPSARRLAGINESLGYAKLMLNLTGLKRANPEKIAELVRSEAAARRGV